MVYVTVVRAIGNGERIQEEVCTDSLHLETLRMGPGRGLEELWLNARERLNRREAAQLKARSKTCGLCGCEVDPMAERCPGCLAALR
jgi:hypothetical protein